MRRLTRTALVLGSSAALLLGTPVVSLASSAALPTAPHDGGGVLGVVLGGLGDRVGDSGDRDDNRSHWTDDVNRWDNDRWDNDRDDERWDKDRWKDRWDDRDGRDRDFRWENDDSDSDDGAAVLELGGLNLITVTEGVEVLSLDLGGDDLDDRWDDDRWNDRWKDRGHDDDRDGLDIGGLLG